MSERDMSFYVVDIFIAIDKIKRYTSKFTNSDDFFRSEMEWDAALRMLQLMGDAINILLDYNLLEKSYRRVVDFRNQIVHGYFSIDEKIVWEVVTKKIKDIEKDLLKLVLKNKMNLFPAIEAAIKENSLNQSILKNLERLKKTLNHG